MFDRQRRLTLELTFELNREGDSEEVLHLNLHLRTERTTESRRALVFRICPGLELKAESELDAEEYYKYKDSAHPNEVNRTTSIQSPNL
jgi:hypothetical protein